MIRATTSVFFLLLGFISLGQELSTENLLADLTFLNEAVINGHPVNYDPNVKVDIHSVLESAKQLEAEELTPLEYRLWISRGIYQVGCVHTSIRELPEIFSNKSEMYPPFSAELDNGKLLITNCSDKSLIGKYIETINGTSVSDFIDSFMEYRGSDGGTDALAKAYLSIFSDVFISWYLGNPDVYEVSTDSGIYTIEASDAQISTPAAPMEKITLSNDRNKFYFKNDIAFLKLSSFRKKDKSFFDKVFDRINESKTDTLVIDLRSNGGGNRKSAIKLTKFLVDEKFDYSILQPKHLKTGRYLNGKGKFFLFLSKLKYNIGDIYRWRKNKSGAEFIYSHKPSKKNRFDGKLFVLTDGFTASSSTMLTTWLSQYTDATFIGSQACGGYNGNNGGSFPLITLPNSKIVIRFPAYRLIVDEDSSNREGLLPEVFMHSKASDDNVIEIIQSM